MSWDWLLPVLLLIIAGLGLLDLLETAGGES